LELGQAKFEIYCKICHGAAADGNGVMKVRSAVEGDAAILTIANLQAPIYRAYPQGQIFDVITNGKNTMQGYGDKLSPEERWAVVAYLRALQLSQSCPADLVPASVKADIK
jgi:mono/diheme cytochrome c family protein